MHGSTVKITHRSQRDRRSDILWCALVILHNFYGRCLLFILGHRWSSGVVPLVLQFDGGEVANVIVHSVGLGSLSSTRRYQVQELVEEKKKQDAARQAEPGVDDAVIARLTRGPKTSAEPT